MPKSPVRYAAARRYPSPKRKRAGIPANDAPRTHPRARAWGSDADVDFYAAGAAYAQALQASSPGWASAYWNMGYQLTAKP